MSAMELNRKALLLYALPGIPLAVLTLPLYILLPTFYAQALGLPLAAIGTAFFVIRLVDAFSDPIIGSLSDSVIGPLGRRRSWFVFSLPLTAGAAFMLFWPPANAGVTHLLFWGVMLSLGYTASILPYNAWGAELSSNYAMRARGSAYREGFILIGTLIAVALPFTFFTMEDASAFHGLAALSVFVVICLPLLGGLMVWRLPEPENRSRQKVSVREGLSEMRANGPFLRVLAA